MDRTDQLLLNILQGDFPLVAAPFQEIAKKLGIMEEETLVRTLALKDEGIIRQISAIFDSRRLGYDSSLVAMKILSDRLDEAAAFINQHPGVSHNYARNHDFNLWFTLTIPKDEDIRQAVKKLEAGAYPDKTLILPALRLFKIGVNLDVTGDSNPTDTQDYDTGMMRDRTAQTLSRSDIQLIRALQEDITITSEPFEVIASSLGLSTDELLIRAQDMIKRGLMRRFAAVLRHRQAGFTANAMGVWVVPENDLERIGRIMSSFRSVSHCYQRPTYPPDWPYNVFTMIHAKEIPQCLAVLRAISETTEITNYTFLYGTKEYKKTRVKYFV